MGKSIKMVYYAIVIVLIITYIVWITRDPNAASGMGLWISYILGGIAVIGTLVSSLLFIVNHPKNAKKLLIAIGALALICVVSYTMSSGDVLDSYADYGVTTTSKSKLIDMGLYLSLFLGIGAAALAIVTEAVSLFKN
ncbi:hypothetical protein OAD66_05155 [Bacteroidia bacterium]|nr:hypothetical protein [Bacteroidia bacterium]MDB9882503.1 hypothetical protein [Bacteroidia bacterium]